jgi:hypothetical protein
LKFFAFFPSRWWLLVPVLPFLWGCASVTSPLSELVSKFNAQGADAVNAQIANFKPNPQRRYLRVEVAGRPPALLVLGHVDAHPQGDIEVWYTNSREVIKIQNGRIIATIGLGLDWRNVTHPNPPAWLDLMRQGGVYTRLRDVTPGYHYNISEQIALQSWVGVPPIKLPVSLSVEQARTYLWFRETAQGSSGVNTALPPAWFAWGTHRGQPTVVYSEQCLSPTVCLTWQRWPTQESAS